MRGSKWDRRIQRADELAAAHPFAAEGLRFYAALASFQKSLYEGLEPGMGSLEGDLDRAALLPWLPPFLELIQQIAPPPLAQPAAALSAAGEARRAELLEEFWREGPADLDPVEGLLAWAFLQPYAEHLADRIKPEEIHATPSLCPLCGAPPLVGVLRPQGDGGKRSLICSLCAHEWDFRRIVCAACGEESVEKLPVYVAEELPHVRVEACDTCHSYIKTIDMTKEGRAVPVVDEIAAIPLSLWAAEKGYEKVRGNLLGV
ncbi:MAG: formate dehydrogenase accessory protein FdhE [Thermoanaerobaculia bacterium]